MLSLRLTMIIHDKINSTFFCWKTSRILEHFRTKKRPKTPKSCPKRILFLPWKPVSPPTGQTKALAWWCLPDAARWRRQRQSPSVLVSTPESRDLSGLEIQEQSFKIQVGDWHFPPNIGEFKNGAFLLSIKISGPCLILTLHMQLPCGLEILHRLATLLKKSTFCSSEMCSENSQKSYCMLIHGSRSA